MPLWPPCAPCTHLCLARDGRRPALQASVDAPISLGELRGLPDILPGWLAELLQAVEHRDCWSARLAEGYTALIPKEGPPGAFNVLPLTVVSMVYSL